MAILNILNMCAWRISKKIIYGVDTLIYYRRALLGGYIKLFS